MIKILVGYDSATHFRVLNRCRPARREAAADWIAAEFSAFRNGAVDA
jgi:hypothetical protein